MNDSRMLQGRLVDWRWRVSYRRRHVCLASRRRPWPATAAPAVLLRGMGWGLRDRVCVADGSGGGDVGVQGGGQERHGPDATVR